MAQDLTAEQTYAPLTPEPTLLSPAVSVTATGSPMTITAYRRQAIAFNGTLSTLSYTRGALTALVGIGASMVEMNPGDKITVTYLIAPTITLIPR